VFFYNLGYTGLMSLLALSIGFSIVIMLIMLRVAGVRESGFSHSAHAR